jgi:hypothetical protein
MKSQNDKYKKTIFDLNVLNYRIHKKNIYLINKLKKKEKLINDIYKKINNLNTFI